MKIKLVIPFIAIMLYSCNQKPFNKEIWKSNNGDDSFTLEDRNEMLDDLINNQHLIGKKTSEVKEILGNPDEDNFENKNQNILQYTVLIEWSGIDPSSMKYLNLRFNKKNRIDSVFISKSN